MRGFASLLPLHSFLLLIIPFVLISLIFDLGHMTALTLNKICYSFNNYFLSTYNMSGTILSTEDIELTNKDKIPAFVKLTFDSMLDDKK